MRPLDAQPCLVTGGAGYLGRNLIAALQKKGCRVRGLDLAGPPSDDALVDVDKLEWIQGDIRDADVVAEACEGIDTVFHTAALIELFTWYPKEFGERVRSVNVGGTQALLEAARRAGVKRLVHTSSTAAVFEQDTTGGDESGPYSISPDLYASTKVESEKLALEANGVGGLLTCAIRPGGIYGPRERGTLIGPLVQSLHAGQPLLTLGRRDVLLDYTYIDNLVDGQLRAAERLVEGSPVCGQPYFITDGSPMNTGAFSQRLVQHMDLDVKRIHVSGAVAQAITYLLERAFQLFGKPKTPLTFATVRMCEIDNYFSIDKARRDLEYSPLLDTHEGLRRTAAEAREYYDSL